METDNLPVRTGNRGARGDGNALPDRAAGQRKMIVRLDIGCKSMNAAACGCAFVGNDGTGRKIMGDDLSGGERIERAARTTKTNPTNRRSYANRTMSSGPGVVVGQFE